jgi:hypothetical protein
VPLLALSYRGLELLRSGCSGCSASCPAPTSRPTRRALADTATEHASPCSTGWPPCTCWVRDQPNRYALHDLVRRYARELVVHDPDRTAAADRLGGFLPGGHPGSGRNKLRANGPHRGGRHRNGWPAGQLREWPGRTDWLDTELANLVAAVRRAAEEGAQPLAWLLADALRGYFWIRRQMEEWLCHRRGRARRGGGAARPPGMAAMRLSLGLAERCSRGINKRTSTSIRRWRSAATSAGRRRPPPP